MSKADTRRGGRQALVGDVEAVDRYTRVYKCDICVVTVVYIQHINNCVYVKFFSLF